MKAVMASVPDHILEWRKKTGADQWDEMWDGVLHMPPAPNRLHQNIEWELETWLRMHWAQPLGNRVYHQINVAPPGGWPDKNYRIPDLVLLTPERFHIDRNEYFEGAPAVVIEIHAPGDEAYEKLPFYAELGVPEVWIIHRDTRQLELFVLEGGEYVRHQAGFDRWLQNPATGIQFRSVPGEKLAIRRGEDESSQAELPSTQ
ncbi:MAG: Uma2 family endonuclease [Planctomycetes bacterium]|nr:Uma2 family endonuclease [Planctomycetota bacterium]